MPYYNLRLSSHGETFGSSNITPKSPLKIFSEYSAGLMDLYIACESYFAVSLTWQMLWARWISCVVQRTDCGLGFFLGEQEWICSLQVLGSNSHSTSLEESFGKNQGSWELRNSQCRSLMMESKSSAGSGSSKLHLIWSRSLVSACCSCATVGTAGYAWQVLPPLKCGGATIAMVNYSLELLLASLLKWHLLSTATDSHSFKLLTVTQVKLWEASDILSPSQEAPNWQLDNTVLFHCNLCSIIIHKKIMIL